MNNHFGRKNLIPLGGWCRHRNNHNCCLRQNLLQFLVIFGLIQIVSKFFNRMQVFHFANNQWIQFGKTFLKFAFGELMNDSYWKERGAKLSIDPNQLHKISEYLHISLSMSAAMLFASTINWYSGSDSTLPIISWDFLGRAMYSSIFRRIVFSRSESCNLHTSRIDDTYPKLNATIKIRKRIIPSVLKTDSNSILFISRCRRFTGFRAKIKKYRSEFKLHFRCPMLTGMSTSIGS